MCLCALLERLTSNVLSNIELMRGVSAFCCCPFWMLNGLTSSFPKKRDGKMLSLPCVTFVRGIIDYFNAFTFVLIEVLIRHNVIN